MTPERQAVLNAIKDLVQDEDPRPKLEALEAVFPLLRRYPIALTGAWSILNPLLYLRLEDEEEWEVAKTRIDVRREKEGRSLCWPSPKPPKFEERYNEYQRVLMQEIRARGRRASSIENMQRAATDQIRGNARQEFERTMQHKWGARRDALLEQARQRSGGRLSREERRRITDEFWAGIDLELDRLEEKVRREHLKPAHQRRSI